MKQLFTYSVVLFALIIGWAAPAAGQNIGGSGTSSRFAVQEIGGALRAGLFDVSGTLLTNDIVITPASGVEIRILGVGSFVTTPITLTQTGGTVANTTIEFRPTTGTYTFSIGQTQFSTVAITSTGAGNSPQTITCFVLGNPRLVSVHSPSTFHANLSGSPSARVTAFWRLRVEGLAASTQYKATHVLALVSNSPTNTGAGNPYFLGTDGVTRLTTAGASLTAANQHDTITTDASGNYEAWFGIHPTNNSPRFTPDSVLFPRLIISDMANTANSNVFPTATVGSRVIDWNAAMPSLASSGQTIYGISNAPPRELVLLYNNTTGSGRPLAITIVENDAVSPNSSATFYSTNVNGQTGRWGTVIPGILPNGVRRIERRSYATGAIVNVSTDADGAWPSGANTVNPGGGSAASANPIVITATDAPLDGTSSIEGISDAAGGELSRALRLGPNPAYENTRLMGTLEMGGRLELELMSGSGTRVHQEVVNVSADVDHTVDLADLAPGFYVLRGRLGALTGTWKLVKR